MSERHRTDDDRAGSPASRRAAARSAASDPAASGPLGNAPHDAHVGPPPAGQSGGQGERAFPSPRATPRQAKPLHEWETRPRILVSNDDGIDSRGLLMLKKALEPIGDVYVMAPEANQSAMGHAMTFMRPLRVRQRVLGDGQPGWSIDGSPTDAVSLSLLGYFGVSFDLVAAGINYGPNLGDDVTISGTVGAAMEAVLSGCPAFAISQELVTEPDFSLASEVAALVARNILEHGLGAGELLNVNVPDRSVEDVAGIEITRMGKRVTQDQLVERLDPRGTPYYWFGGPPPVGLAEPGTDFHAVHHGKVAITPIQLDLTASRLLARLARWQWQLPRLPGEADAPNEADAPSEAEEVTADQPSRP